MCPGESGEVFWAYLECTSRKNMDIFEFAIIIA